MWRESGIFPLLPHSVLALHTLRMPEPPLTRQEQQRAGRKKGLVLNCKKGRVIWGTVFGPTAAASLPRGSPRGRITQEPCGDWRVENFAKTSVLFGCSKYFQNHWLSQSSYFIKPLQISTVFLLFHMDMEAKERKNVATCVYSTFHFQVLGFLRHEHQGVILLRCAVPLDFSFSER